MSYMYIFKEKLMLKQYYAMQICTFLVSSKILILIFCFKISLHDEVHTYMYTIFCLHKQLISVCLPFVAAVVVIILAR